MTEPKQSKFPELERKFRKAIKQAHEEINEHIAKAEKELNKAVSISEKYGIPFRPSISPLAQDYCPTSFSDMWSPNYDDDDYQEKKEIISDILNDSDVGGIPEYDGWQHSAVC